MPSSHLSPARFVTLVQIRGDYPKASLKKYLEAWGSEYGESGLSDGRMKALVLKDAPTEKPPIVAERLGINRRRIDKWLRLNTLPERSRMQPRPGMVESFLDHLRKGGKLVAGMDARCLPIYGNSVMWRLHRAC